MKTSSLLFALAALAAALPTGAATARTYPDALSKAGHKPIVLFCYGANYDEVSQKAYDEFIKKHKLQAATRNCVFVEVPIYQLPDERQKKEMERIIGKRGLPGGIFSYPSLAVVDDGGNLRGIVQRYDEIKDADSASAALTKLLEAYDKQEDLIVKAEKAGGTRKAQLLMQASEVRGINLPPDAGEGGKRNKDMKDNVGLGARKGFDPISVMEKTFNMEQSQVEGYIRDLLSKPGYSLTQRQEMYAALAGHVRRNGGSPDKLRKLYTEMRDLDPDSMYGAYAQGALDMWVDKKAVAKNDIPTEINRPSNTIIADSDGPSLVISDNSANDTDDTPVIVDPRKTALGTRATPAPAPKPAEKSDDSETESMADE